ncbi:MAG: hypothetical protein D6741_13865 [Planctomycetota bacterium]|nr:MAG: hypothetical protein D6741_13865 [Planctomycetota bacterium]
MVVRKLRTIRRNLRDGGGFSAANWLLLFICAVYVLIVPPISRLTQSFDFSYLSAAWAAGAVYLGGVSAFTLFGFFHRTRAAPYAAIAAMIPRFTVPFIVLGIGRWFFGDLVGLGTLVYLLVFYVIALVFEVAVMLPDTEDARES